MGEELVRMAMMIWAIFGLAGAEKMKRMETGKEMGKSYKEMKKNDSH